MREDERLVNTLPAPESVPATLVQSAPEPQVEDDDINALKKIKNFPIWKILYRNLIMIIIVTLLFGGIGTLYGLMTARPKYTATCSVLLSISLDSTVAETNSATDISLSKLYLPTITEVIASPAVIKNANEAYKGEGKLSLNSVGISYRDNSLIFAMKYTDETPELAVAKLKMFVEAGAQELNVNGPKYVPAKEFILTKTQKDSNFRITKYHDGYKFVAIGFAIGAVGSIGFAILHYILDNKVKSASELEEITGVSVIAYIEKM